MAGRLATEEAEPAAPAIGLSPAFDSISATMRLAALTNAPEEVEEVAKTLRLMRPGVDAINQAAPTKAPPAAAATRTIPLSQPAAARAPAASAASSLGNWLLIGIILLVVVGVALVFIL